MADRINLSVVTQESTLFDEPVSEVQLPAFDGYMGFRPDHAPFVSTLGVGTLLIRQTDKPDTVFTISGGGYFEIHQNVMIVLADVAEPAVELDMERAVSARNRAMRRLSGEDPGNWDLDRARSALARAENRIRAIGMIRLESK